MKAPAYKHARGVIDTDTLLMLPRLESADALPAEPLITAVTLAELSVGPLVAASAKERAQAADATQVVQMPLVDHRRVA